MRNESSRWGSRFSFPSAAFWVLLLILTACGGGGGGGGGDDDGGSITSGDYVVLAWNDLGMHCLNPTYDRLIILPPYNTLWAQVIERGNPPRIVTDGVQVHYAILNNTTSLNKLSYDQFWEPAVLALFGAGGLAPDTGLNLRDPAIHNGLSGNMQQVGDHFQADGIPVTPVRDGTSTKDPYQIAQITVRNSGGTTLVQTRAMVPTSDEINCGRCHAPGGTTAQVFNDILIAHDAEEGTALTINRPVLCAACHGSPVLGAAPGDRGSSGLYLSEAIHGFHSGQTAPGGGAITCYDCHPGNQTQCNRSLAHTSGNGNCVTCHGTLSAMAASITGGSKVPWVDEPACADCHDPGSIQEVDTGATLYRNATGHGGIYCAACHQSPHAMIPSREATDNYQAVQYQDAAVTIASCAACHDSSRGEDEGISGFRETHAGSNPEHRSACSVCHTALPANVTATQFPHQFTWQDR
ncbi:MAG: hypothetical protein HY911_01720 [Desulfobacterales bacterium]|nr:hypothetical protein [Desulfobacterales bacterium]